MNIEIRGKTKHMCKAELKFATAFFARYRDWETDRKSVV